MRRVLIIDDDPFYANLVSKMFAQRGWHPVVCFNMEDALRTFNPKHVRLIVTDIFMPGMGGIEGIAVLRQMFDDAIIIAMSGGWDNMTSKDTIEAALKIGADAGLQKPITATALDHVLSDLKVRL